MIVSKVSKVLSRAGGSSPVTGSCQRRYRRVVVIAATVCLALGTTLAICELLTRMVPGPWHSKQSLGYTFDSDVGIWMRPGPRTLTITTSSGNQCRWYINSFGMHDGETTIEKPAGTRRLAILGDSFIQGDAVARNERLTNVLQTRVATEWQVLNFGLSSLGTVQEVEVYKHKAAQFAPDIVVLAFYPGNDVCNNSREIEMASGYMFLQESPYYTVNHVQELIFHPATSRRTESVKNRVYYSLKNFASFRATCF